MLVEWLTSCAGHFSFRAVLPGGHCLPDKIRGEPAPGGLSALPGRRPALSGQRAAGQPKEVVVPARVGRGGCWGRREEKRWLE